VKSFNKKKYVKLPKEAIKYCLRRKIPKDKIKEFKWCKDPISAYYNRLIIPYKRNSDGMIYGFNARLINEKLVTKFNPKYKKSLVHPLNISVYNLYNIDNEKPVYVVEGEFDSFCIKNLLSSSNQCKIPV
jgi:DNA primase